MIRREKSEKRKKIMLSDGNKGSEKMERVKRKEKKGKDET